MVPTFGMFDFLAERRAKTHVAEGEREAYLAEVRTFSTEFGARSDNEATLRDKACLRMAFLLNQF